jgi:hypothetical protein
MARKPAALARELLRNFPKGRRGGKGRRRKKAAPGSEDGAAPEAVARRSGTNGEEPTADEMPETTASANGDAPEAAAESDERDTETAA